MCQLRNPLQPIAFRYKSSTNIFIIAGIEESLEITIYQDGGWNLTKITKPNFQQMTRKELKKYTLAHPTDDEAMAELFINRRNPNVTVSPSPYAMPYEEVEAIFKSQLNRHDSSVLINFLLYRCKIILPLRSFAYTFAILCVKKIRR